MSLRTYVVKRIGQILVVYWAFITLLFLMFRALPGDPASMFAADLPPEAREQMIEDLGLNEPLYVQYFEYMGQLVQGKFGASFYYNEPVYPIIVTRFWNTVILMGAAMIVAYVIGFTLGSLLGWYRDTKFEKGGLIAALIARSSPEFWTSIILLSIFSFYLGWFPSGGMSGVGARPADMIERFLSPTFLHHATLPVLAAAIYYLATPTLLMRTTMIDVMKSDFIEMKKAAGVPDWVILYKHAARNSMLPLVTMAAIATGIVIGGSLIIETVFNWPGMGREMIQAVSVRDYPMAQATFFLMGTVVIFMNLVADLVYVYLDPRVAYE